MKRFISGLLVLMFSFAVMAQNDSMIMVRKSDVPASLIKKYEVEQTIQTVGKLAGWGKEVGVAVDAGLSALGDNIEGGR